MKKLLNFGGMGIFLLFIIASMAYPQADKETLSRKEAQVEIGTDNDQYVIGAEDVLSIHVWKEDTFTRTIPVRMDGKISPSACPRDQSCRAYSSSIKGSSDQKVKGIH